MELKLSLITNVAFYIIIGILIFKMMTYGETKPEDHGYKKFALVNGYYLAVFLFVYAL